MTDKTTDANGTYAQNSDGKYSAFNLAGVFMGTFPDLASAQAFLVDGNHPVAPKASS